MTNLLQENIEIESHRTNSTFGFLPTHRQTLKNQKSYFLAIALAGIKTEEVILETE
jgi:hypothetical protein